MVTAQDDLPCPLEPLSLADIDLLEAPWVDRCSHCFQAATTATATQLPAYQTPTSSPTLTLTPTATRTLTPSPTLEFSPTPTQESLTTLAGGTLTPIGVSGEYATTFLGGHQIAPGYSLLGQWDADSVTTTNGVIWDIVGFYYYIDPSTITSNSSFAIQETPDSIYSEDFGAFPAYGDLSNFGCFDAEIFVGSFDWICDELSITLQTNGDIQNPGGFQDYIFQQCGLYGYCPFGVLPDLSEIRDWLLSCPEDFGAYCAGVFHQHTHHITPTKLAEVGTFSFSLAWWAGDVIHDEGIPTPPPALSTTANLYAILRSPFAGNYQATPLPTVPPEPPSCPAPLFNSATNYLSDGAMSPYQLDYWENAGETRYPAGETVFDGSNLTSYPYKTTISGTVEHFVGITAMFDLRGQREITGFRYGAVLPSEQPYKSFFVRMGYYSESVGQWTISLPAYLAPDQTLSINNLHDDITHVWMRIEFRYNSNDAVKASNSTITLPLTTIQVRNESSGEWIDFSRSACDIEGTSNVATATPTSSPTATATGGIPTFTRTPTRTLTPTISSPSPTGSVDTYCMNPRWRQTPTPTQQHTATLNATTTLEAATQTPQYLDTILPQFTQTAQAPTDSAFTATAAITATQAQNATATAAQGATNTAVFPSTATWIASTPGNEIGATYDAMATQMHDQALLGTPSGEGGDSPFTINLGNPQADGGNSTIDLNHPANHTLLAFKWDAQPRPGQCYIFVPEFEVSMTSSIQMVSGIAPDVPDLPESDSIGKILGRIFGIIYRSDGQGGGGGESPEVAETALEIPEMEVCANWVDVPTIVVAGITFPEELFLIPIFVLVFRYIWRLL